MAKYFFDTQEDADANLDHDGVECADVEAARSLAIVSLTELARDALPVRTHLSVLVRDEQGEVVAHPELTFRFRGVER